MLDDEQSTATRRFAGDGFQFELRQHYRWPDPRWEDDPAWKFTDKAGHVHAYGDGFTTPTLIRKRVELWEDGDDLSYTVLVCLECGEEIEPGRRRIPQTAVKSEFSGTYEGKVPTGLDLPFVGTEFEVSTFMPGFSGKAFVTMTEKAMTAGKPSTCRIEFDGQGALGGFDSLPR